MTAEREPTTSDHAPEREEAPSHPPSRWRARLRRWLRRLIWTLVFSLLALLVILALIPVALNTAWARRQIESRAGELLGRGVTLEGLRLSWGGRLDVEGFSIAPREGEPQQPLFAFKTFRLRWGWKPLFSKKVRVDEMRLDGLRLTVARSREGLWNLLTLIPPASGEPEPPPPEKPAGEPLKELPLEALHVSLRDWRVDFLDEGGERRMEGAFALTSLELHLDSPADPLRMEALGRVEAGPGRRSAPWNATLTVTPGAGGFLEWRELWTALDASFAGQDFSLSVRPHDVRPGIATRIETSIRPAPLAKLAEAALGEPLPASAEGELRASLAAVWDGATSAAAQLRADYTGLRVAAAPLGPAALDLGDFAAALEVASGDPGAGGAAFSRWILRGASFDCRYIQMFANGEARGIGAGLQPEWSLRLGADHRFDSVRPLLGALGIALPPQAGTFRGLVWRGACEGGLAAPIHFDGALAAELAPLGNEEGASAYLGLRHEVAFDLAGDSLRARVAAGEFAAPPATATAAPFAPAWTDLDLRVQPAMAASRAGDLAITLRPEPALARVVALGLAPEGWATTGALTLDARFALPEAGPMEIASRITGALGVFVADPAAPAIPPALAALPPADMEFREIGIDVRRAPSGRLDVHSAGGVRLRGGWIQPPPPPAPPPAPGAGESDAATTIPLRIAAAIPAQWDFDFTMPESGPMLTRLDLASTPALSLAGPMTLDREEALEFAMRLGVDPAAGALDLESATLDFGGWTRLALATRLEEWGRRQIETTATLDMELGEALLAWIPQPFDAIGLALAGRANGALALRGRWDAERPRERLITTARLGCHLDRLRVGAPAEAAPLTRGRDWNFTLESRVESSPAQPLETAEVQTKAALGHTDSLGMAALENLSAGFAARYETAEPARLGAQARIGRLAAGAGPAAVVLDGSWADLRMELEPAPLHVRFERLAMGVPGLAEFSARAEFTSATQTFDAAARAALTDLRRAAALPLESARILASEPAEGLDWTLPASAAPLYEMIRRFSDMDGAAEMAFEAAGRVPRPEELRALAPPVSARVSLALRDVSTTMPLAVSVALEDLDFGTTVSFEPPVIAAAADGGLSETRVGGPYPLTAQGFSWGGAMRLDWEAASASWSGVELRSAPWGLALRSEGEISGWKDFVDLARGRMNAPAPPGDSAAPAPAPAVDLPWIIERLRALSARMNGEIAWSSEDWTAIGPPAMGMRMRGLARAYSQARQEAGRKMRMASGLELRDFAFEKSPSLRLGGGSGRLESLLAGRRRVEAPAASAFLSDQLFAETGAIGRAAAESAQWRPPQADQDSTLRFEEIAFGPWILRDVTVSSRGDLRRWTAEFNCGDLLGGAFRSRMELLEEEAPAGAPAAWILSAEMEMTGVSARGAIPQWRALPPEETEISGLGSLRWRLDPQAATPEELLRGLEARFVVTRIGSRALQGFLLALDPKEETPAFVNARRGLNLGRPDFFRLELRRGLLDMEIGLTTFTGLGARLPVLRRAPVAEILRLESLRPALEGVARARDGLQSLALLDTWVTPGAAMALPAAAGDGAPASASAPAASDHSFAQEE